MSTTKEAQRSRFKDAPWYPRQEISILIGGAGGIGSWLSLLLSRAGFRLFVYDHDFVEIHNIGGQLYGMSDVGTHKVSALLSLIKELSGDDIDVISNKIDEDSPSNNIVISAFDNMKARRDMFESWRTKYSSDPTAIFMDGRLQAEHMQIFCVRGGSSSEVIGQQKVYDEVYLFDDSQVEDAPCTMKQTSHAAAMIASHMTGFLTNHITNIVEDDTTRTIPFFWEYFIPMDYLNVKNE